METATAAPASVKVETQITTNLPPTASLTASSTNSAIASVATTTSTIVAPQLLHNLPIELQNDQKRRSSSRSIKRKRFDDEIVEYSIGFPQSRGGGDQSRVGRPRTTSQSYVPPPVLPPLLQASVSMPPEVNVTPSTGSESLPGTPAPTALLNASGIATSSTIATSSVSTNLTHTPLSVERTPVPERRRQPRSNNKRTKRTGRPPNQITTKDLGRWKPIDDLALIVGIQQTNDLRMVHRGIKFSCKFSLQELQARWYSLMFDPAISRIAVSAMRNLHPELIESVQRKALFSVQEEELLGTIKSSDTPKLEQFQELLDKHAAIFFSARTAKTLNNHWQLMKQYQLLPDQLVKPLQMSDQPLTFSDAEDLIFDADLHEQRDESLEIELALTDRHNKREIRLLENELSRWSVLVDTVLGTAVTPEFDGQTLAVLRGRLVRYLMRSKEITFGRDAKDCVVDVDLSLEGPAAKISRRQGTIKLRSNGDFFIANEGKRAIFIDGTPLLTGSKTRLAHNCIVEIAGLRFAFLVNYELINAIRHESAKTTAPLN